jgi:hypothetical protein
MDKNSEMLLAVCYRLSHYTIAEKIIKAGALFDISYLALLNSSRSITEIEIHLQKIKLYIQAESAYSAEKIVNAHYSFPLFVYSSDLNYESVNIVRLLNVTYTSDNAYYSNFARIYENFSSSNIHIIKEVISVVQYCKNYEINVKILSPLLKEGYKNAFCDYSTKLLFVPFFDFRSQEQSFFVHEATHYVMYKIFNNKGAPFFRVDDNDQALDDYDTAVTKTLCNIQSLFNKSCVSHLNSIYTYHDTIKELKQSGFINFFNFRRNFLDGHVTLNAENEKKLDDRFEKLIVKFNLNSDQIITLERIGEFLDRRSIEHASEFIVRLPELIVRLRGQENLKYFEPLQEFWFKHVSPAVDIYLKTHDCLADESKEENNQCFLGDLKEYD